MAKRVFYPNFVSVINDCKLNLNNLNKALLADIARNISLLKFLQLKPRNSSDKFVDNLAEAMTDTIVKSTSFYKCHWCGLIMTSE